MTKHSILEKKLEELECLIESLTFNDVDPKVYRDIELRVNFVTTLLVAEISSRPMEAEGEEITEERLKFACMAKRLNELEEAFKTNRFSVRDDESLDSNDSVGDGEAGSVYSRMDSCQEELGKAEEEKEEDVKGDVDADQWPLFQDASWDEKKSEEAEQWPLFEDASTDEKSEVKFPEVGVREVKEKRRFGFIDLVCFGLVGVIITLLLGCISDITEEGPFLTPT